MKKEEFKQLNVLNKWCKDILKYLHDEDIYEIVEAMNEYAEYYHKAKIEEILPKNDRHILVNFINHKSFDWDKQIFSVRIIKPLLEKLLNDL